MTGNRVRVLAYFVAVIGVLFCALTSYASNASAVVSVLDTERDSGETFASASATSSFAGFNGRASGSVGLVSGRLKMSGRVATNINNINASSSTSWSDRITIVNPAGVALPPYLRVGFHISGVMQVGVEYDDFVLGQAPFASAGANFSVYQDGLPFGQVTVSDGWGLKIEDDSSVHLVHNMEYLDRAIQVSMENVVFETLWQRPLLGGGQESAESFSADIFVDLARREQLDISLGFLVAAGTRLGRAEADFGHTLEMTSILFPNGETPESHGISLVFDSGMVSPNLTVVTPEPTTAVTVLIGAFIVISRRGSTTFKRPK